MDISPDKVTAIGLLIMVLLVTIYSYQYGYESGFNSAYDFCQVAP